MTKVLGRTGALVVGLHVVIYFLSATSCFRQGDKVADLDALSDAAADVVITAPLAFSLNKPMVPVSADSFALSWSPASGAAIYHAIVSESSSCSIPVVEAPTLSDNRMPIVGLDDGTWYFCVTAISASGERRDADNNGAAFVVDRSPPYAEVVVGGSVLDNPAAIRVAGDGVSSFRFKAGPVQAIDCGEDISYSDPLSIEALARAYITGPDQEWLMCILGRDLAGNEQPLTEVTTHTWQASATGRSFGFNFDSVIGGSAAVGGVVNLIGTAENGWLDPIGTKVSLRNIAGGRCLGDDGLNFAQSCPFYKDVGDGANWQMSVAIDALTKGARYELSVEVDDTLEGGRRLSDVVEFSWIYGFHGIHAGDAIRLTKTLIATDDARIYVGDTRGALKRGLATFAEPEAETGYDIFVGKNSSDGQHLWSRRFVGSGEDASIDAAIDAQGDIYILAELSGDFTDNLGALPAVGSGDILVFKVSGANGNVLWQRQLASSGADRGGGIELSGDQVIVTGSSCGNIDFGGGSNAIANCAAFIAAFSQAAGAYNWSQVYSGNSTVYPGGVALDPAGNIYWSGYFWGTLTFGDTALVSSGAEDGYLAKTTPDGSLVLVYALAGAGSQRILAVTVKDADEVLLAGRVANSASLNGTTIVGSSSGESLFVAKVTDKVAVSWAQVVTATSGDVEVLDINSVGDVYYLTAAFDGAVSFGSQKVSTVGDQDLAFVKGAVADGSFSLADSFGSVHDDVSGNPRISIDNSAAVFSIRYFSDPAKIGNLSLPDFEYFYATSEIRYRP